MGAALLLGQILLFSLLFLLSNLFRLFVSPFLVLLFLSGMLVVGFAVFSMDRRSYSPLPSPRRHNVLVRKGVYRVIRHPMYVGLFLIGLAFLLSRFVLPSAVVYAAFVVVTNLKANLEERLMTKKHPEYRKYRLNTRKYIPFVY